MEDPLETSSITCPHCGWTSYNKNDIREGYCGNCHWWTGVPELYAPWLADKMSASEAANGGGLEQTA